VRPTHWNVSSFRGSEKYPITTKKQISYRRYFKVDMEYALRQIKSAPVEGTGLIIRSTASFIAAYAIFLSLKPLGDLGWNIPVLDQIFEQFAQHGISPPAALGISFALVNLGIFLMNYTTIRRKSSGSRRTPPPRVIYAFGNLVESTGYLMRSFMFAGFIFVNAIKMLNNGERDFGLKMMAVIIPGVFIGRIIEKIGNNFSFPRKSHQVEGSSTIPPAKS